jgi:hypothetical protein
VVFPSRAFLGETGDHLEHVVLHHIANRPGLFVESAAASHAETLGHGDLHALDVFVIPASFDERIGEAKVDQVLHRLLAEIVVDAEDGLLGEVGVERAVQLLGRGKVAAERLLDHHAGISDAARLCQPCHDGGEQARWDGQIE